MRDSSVLLSHDTEFLYSTYAAESQFARRNCTDIAVGYKQKQGQLRINRSKDRLSRGAGLKVLTEKSFKVYSPVVPFYVRKYL